MNTWFFIARKMLVSSDSDRETGGLAKVISIAVISISLGLAVMIVAIAVVTGFQKSIREKVIGFGGHIVVSSFNMDQAADIKPIPINPEFLDEIRRSPQVSNVSPYALKAGIIKTDDEVYGVVVKGITNAYDPNFFQSNLLSGKIPRWDPGRTSDEVLISKNIADKLRIREGDKFRVFFIQDPVRQRAFTISGIYSTGMAQLDESFILADMRHIQKLNAWDSAMVEGFEINLKRYEDLEAVDDLIYETIGMEYNTVKITDRYQEIFGWLGLLDINVVVILFFATLVAGINMITALLILVIGKTRFIGIMKALGASDGQVTRIFLIKSAMLIGRGLIIGNLMGIGMCILQQNTGIFTLPEESYYLSQVPVNLDWRHLVIVNTGTFLVCFLMLLVPAKVVTKITPVKALRFE